MPRTCFAMLRINHDQTLPSRSCSSGGFTLLELLLAVVLGGLFLSGITSLAVSMIRSSLQEERSQVAQDSWNRVQQFLLTEVGEAGRSYSASVETVPIQLAAAISDCSGTPIPPVMAAFAIRLRNPSDPSAAPVPIYFYNQDGHLWRCGPPVLSDGSLNFNAASVVAILSYNTTLVDLAVGHSDRSLSYTIVLTSPRGGVIYSGRGRAWAQSSLIEAES